MSTLKNNMSHIIIGFSKPRKFKILSWLIRKLEKTDFSHVYVKIYDDRINRYIVYEASGLIVHSSDQDTFYKKNKPISELIITCTIDEMYKVLSQVTDVLALPYGIKQLIGLGLVRLCRFFGIRIKNPFSDGRKTYICSEFCGLILNKLHYKFDNLDELTPKDIYEIIYGKIS